MEGEEKKEKKKHIQPLHLLIHVEEAELQWQGVGK